MHITTLTHYLQQAALTTFYQLALLLGPGLALALVMHLLAGFIADKACRLIGRNAFLALFGWLGTMVHEAGHLLFCMLFGHRIIAVKWFDPDGNDGTIGYVRHSFDRHSLYQRIGNFFIGIGPILLGAAVIFSAGRFLLPAELFAALRQTAADAMSAAPHSLAAVTKSLAHRSGTVFTAIFTGNSLTSWKFHLFLYLTFAVGSSIRLSPADIHGAASGFFALVGLLFGANLLTNWLGIVPLAAFRTVSSACGFLNLMLIFAILLNTVVAAVLLLLAIVRPGKRA